MVEGNRGAYLPRLNPPVRGVLDQVRYVPRVNHSFGPPTPAIFGRWTLGEQSGYFVFRHPDYNRVMDGYWGYFTHQGRFGPIVGSWNGRLVAVSDGQLSRDPRDTGPVAPD